MRKNRRADYQGGAQEPERSTSWLEQRLTHLIWPGAGAQAHTSRLEHRLTHLAWPGAGAQAHTSRLEHRLTHLVWSTGSYIWSDWKPEHRLTHLVWSGAGAQAHTSGLARSGCTDSHIWSG